MSNIAAHIKEVKATLPGNVTLVAVSKFHPAETLMEAYDAGQRVFGESRVQELCAKREALPADIEWHFIGTLQNNKVKYIAPFIQLIHSIDSAKLLQEADRRAEQNNRIIDILLEFHIATEASKHGFTWEECVGLMESGMVTSARNIRIRGVMGMATFSKDEQLLREEFRTLKRHFETLKQHYFSSDAHFNILSMGMSDDYPVAIEEGSNMVRIGSKIFGERG